MKRALIGGLSVLAMIVGVSAANAQANINPNIYRGNTSGPYGAQAPWEWHAGPGPERRGNMCLAHVDLNRGYGTKRRARLPRRRRLPQRARKRRSQRADPSAGSALARMTRSIRPAACDACGRP